jgi:plastocyanin domain-containing protein
MKRSSILLPLIAAVIAVAGFTIAQQKKASSDVQTATITVDAQGFQPSSLTLKPDVAARITFVRTTDQTCGTSVVIPDYKIQKDLPLNQPVVVEFTPKKGTFGFACGMYMLKGKIVVQ